MTNEEAIKELKILREDYWDEYGDTMPALDIAIKALEQESVSTCKYGVLHKIAEFFRNWDGDETAKMEISVKDMREIASIFRKQAYLEHQLKEIKQHPEDAISREMPTTRGAMIKVLEYKADHIKTKIKPQFFRDVAMTLKEQKRTAHWVPTWCDGYADGAPVWETWECSNCRYEHNGLEDTLTDYCPGCGAEMSEAKT